MTHLDKLWHSNHDIYEVDLTDREWNWTYILHNPLQCFYLYFGSQLCGRATLSCFVFVFLYSCIYILPWWVFVFRISLYLYFALVGKVLVGRSWIAAPVFLRDCSVCIIWRIGSRPLCTRHTSAVHCPSATCTNSNALLQCSSLQVVEAPMHCNCQPMNYIECQCIFVAARWSLALCCQAALVDNNLFVFCFLFFCILYFIFWIVLSSSSAQDYGVHIALPTMHFPTIPHCQWTTMSCLYLNVLYTFLWPGCGLSLGLG